MELNRSKILRFAIIGLITMFIFSLFFPIRILIPSSTSNLLGSFSDFTAIWLYLSDILLFLILLIAFLTKSVKISKDYLKISLVIITILCFFSYLSGFLSINAYWVLKFIELGVLFWITSNLSLKYEVYLKFGIKVFVVFAVFQSLLAISQHFSGQSLGLYLLGESHLSTTWYQIAKVVAHGTTYLRGYGTFPHPNVLSAYIFTAILWNIWLLHHVVERKMAYIWLISLITLITGLFATFSRGGIIALVISISIVILFHKFRNLLKTALTRLILPLAIGFLLSIGLFYQFFSPRGGISTESIAERAIYNQTALKIISNIPLTGVGLGESMLHMEQYSPVKLEAWQIQPIHNYFLLAASEGGIIFALALLSIFLYFLVNLGRSIWNNPKGDRAILKVTLFAILLGYLFLMQFDHYFYTLQQTQFLLWIILGLISAELKRKQAI